MVKRKADGVLLRCLRIRLEEEENQPLKQNIDNDTRLLSLVGASQPYGGTTAEQVSFHVTNLYGQPLCHGRQLYPRGSSFILSIDDEMSKINHFLSLDNI